jgi:NAD(P)H-hydrate epimerase
VTVGIEERELADLIEATGRAHHAAFAASDGADPDWAIWYAGHLQATVRDRLGSIPSRSELTYLLVAAERAYALAGDDRGEWPVFYARLILAEFRGG